MTLMNHEPPIAVSRIRIDLSRDVRCNVTRSLDTIVSIPNQTLNWFLSRPVEQTAQDVLRRLFIRIILPRLRKKQDADTFQQM
jgi:hypothetical protein